MNSTASPYLFLVPSRAPTRGNVTSFVTEGLRRAIVTLALRPGEPLNKTAICERFGVSRFPVSEALARLQTEGLVDIQPQRGTTVSRVRTSDVREYMLIRKALESEAVRVLVGNHDATLLTALAENLDAQAAAVRRDDRPGFHEHDLAFHDLMFVAMRFDKVRAMIDSTRANLDRARRLIGTPRRLACTLSEHQAIFAAVANEDAAGASAAMRAHIDAVMVELFAFARERPELFADGDTTVAVDKDYFPFG